MEVPITNNKELVCLEYPGIVENVDKALETIGGEQSISKIHNDGSRRLELRFRPEDTYCKPACGDKVKTSNMLLRVRRRKKKNSEEFEYQANVVGLINYKFVFQGMADFQYLPMSSKQINPEEIEHKSLIDDLVLKDLKPRSWIDKPAELHLPPSIFSRIDNPTEYGYKDGTKHKDGYKDPSVNRPSNLIGIARQRRPHYTVFVSFDDTDPVPSEPFSEALEKLKARVKDRKKVEQVKKLFKERPIWSKNALKHFVALTPEQFKFVLPCVAYYFLTGPWRSLWVRLGYDPRKDPASKPYQLVDFRVRQKFAADDLKITPKRSTYMYNLPNTVIKQTAQASVIQQHHPESDVKKTINKSGESTFIFREDLVPAYRQMFYQLIDIDLKEVNELVHQNDNKETECTEKDGWCIENIQEKCRKIMSVIFKKIMNDQSDKSKNNTVDSNEEDSLSEEEELDDAGNEMTTEILDYLQ